MRLLGIESSCDETAASVVEDDRRMLSSIIASRVLERHKFGGVVSKIASHRHAEAIVGVVQQASNDVGTNMKELNAIAVAATPGLIGALLVGINFARGPSLTSGVPLVPVHRLCSHIVVNYLTSVSLEPPFLCLVASGGHTHIVCATDYIEFRVLGCTRDDAMGGASNEATRAMGLPYLGGAFLGKGAELGNPDVFSLSHPPVDGVPFDFSLSGLKAAAINLIHNTAQKGDELPRADLTASLRRAAIDCLMRNVIAAMRETEERRLVIAGDVSADPLLWCELE